MFITFFVPSSVLTALNKKLSKGSSQFAGEINVSTCRWIISTKDSNDINL
ncbi:hypothetical protein [Clostridium estertheticum]|nr:hypothetical protein [Clostridium estertheticum]